MTKTTPNPLQKVLKGHRMARRRYDTVSKELDAQIASLKAKRDAMTRPNTTSLVEQIGKLLLKEYPDRELDVLGPFGLRGQVAIHLYKKGVADDKKFEGDNCISISFVMGDETNPLYVETGEVKESYAKNTLGAVNGMNNVTIPVPPDADLEWLKQYIRE